jgi:hypothetical protein
MKKLMLVLMMGLISFLSFGQGQMARQKSTYANTKKEFLAQVKIVEKAKKATEKHMKEYVKAYKPYQESVLANPGTKLLYPQAYGIAQNWYGDWSNYTEAEKMAGQNWNGTEMRVDVVLDTIGPNFQDTLRPVYKIIVGADSPSEIIEFHLCPNTDDDLIRLFEEMRNNSTGLIDFGNGGGHFARNGYFKFIGSSGFAKIYQSKLDLPLLQNTINNLPFSLILYRNDVPIAYASSSGYFPFVGKIVAGTHKYSILNY